MTSIDDQRLLDYFLWNSYASEKNKLFYVATPKVACTSLKWWISELEGVAEAVRELKTSTESDPELVVHDSLWYVAPQLFVSTQERLDQIKTEGYLTFAVVRNPYKRIFSAWQSKVLLCEPLQMERYKGQEFVSCDISSISDVATSFEQFVEFLYAHEAPQYQDSHWTPQYDLLRPDLFSYTIVSKIEDTKKLNAALSAHLGDAYINPFTTTRANESLIPYLPEFINARSKEIIDQLYARDFELFGYSTELPPAKETFSQEQLSSVLKGIELLRGRHQRIAEMRQHYSNQLEVLTKDKEWLLEQRAAWMTACQEKESQLLALQASIASDPQALHSVRGESEELAELRANFALTNTELEGLKVSSESTKSELEELKANYLLTGTELLELKVSSKSTNAELEELTVSFALTNTELEGLKVSSELSNSELKELRASFTLTSAELEGLKVSSELTSAELEELRASFTLTSTELEALRVSSGLANSELEELRASFALTCKELEELKVSSGLATSELEELRASFALTSKELVALKLRSELTSSELKELRASFSLTSNELDELRVCYELTTSELKESRASYALTSTELQALKVSLGLANSNLEELRASSALLSHRINELHRKHKRYLSVYGFFETAIVARLRRIVQPTKKRKGD
ncbi:sulfotransferase family 2 domain-containing protein [Pseudomonas sp. 10S4]|uniref:sulfotransferase family 2 domain-containing protein n=1 Tax=Pseudomonas sp. 10S4 TaxID=3048583 RepID=UPI002AC9BF84|nr:MULTISPECIES: sulfotransferase family 2 domain-containing protein [unclassified Pseudomonas]MEB0224704.1 sulfotransferase family 2 domain-containing protein [Pseudomonas sp. 5S1]MEB0295842.1 sulfotransferase family 2 domain-containing protein [Pseudomonas sp. 10S4]WPX18455.1 sulfotransferase family 2 domain-containing protein [Pseudomonas sp. 10S4]